MINKDLQCRILKLHFILFPSPLGKGAEGG